MAGIFRNLYTFAILACATTAIAGASNALTLGIVDYATGQLAVATNDDNKLPDTNPPYEDQDPRVGVVSLAPWTVGGYSISGVTAYSKPFLPGNLQQLQLSIGSIVSTSQPTAGIGIIFSDYDFTWPPSNLSGPTSFNQTSLAFSGLTQGTATARAWIDPSNGFMLQQPLDTSLIGSLNSGTASGGSGIRPFASQTSISQVFANNMPFGIYGVIDVTHSRIGQTTSLNAVATVVPVPASVLMLLSAFVGLTVFTGFTSVRRRGST